MSLTIVVPNRNRDLTIVRRSLKSILSQQPQDVQIVLVDYGSDRHYQEALRELVTKLGEIQLVFCPVQRQLWNKARAINIALQKCTTTHLMVADVDMIFHPNFIQEIIPQLNDQDSYYFPVGILTQEESEKELAFTEYKVKFVTNQEATGISIFPSKILKSIQGFDEFYHGWGSEDTDVHVRLGNAGYPVMFQKEQLYFLHQWHPKTYRSKDSKEPYHAGLEQINASYLAMAKMHKRTLANGDKAWGKIPLDIDAQIDTLPQYYTNKETDVIALGYLLQEYAAGYPLHVVLSEHSDFKSTKTTAKKLLGKKTHSFLEMDVANDRILGSLIGSLRNSPYAYSYDQLERTITLKIKIIR